MGFGAKMRQIRTDAGVTLAELSERIGVSTVYLSRVELGKTQPPTSERICQIADALGVPQVELLSVALAERRLTPMPNHALGQQIVALMHLYPDEAEFRRALKAMIAGPR